MPLCLFSPHKLTIKLVVCSIRCEAIHIRWYLSEHAIDGMLSVCHLIPRLDMSHLLDRAAMRLCSQRRAELSLHAETILGSLCGTPPSPCQLLRSLATM